ncbi:splicing factor 45-like [Tetranychus urticae]|uniref:Splicing factor 45 n=1 Tax=Tetranychus urticae TaxID=32264 RepID=T1K658_TETUR|nr:splicing factor 45-like [Tetranychus urticae]XP_015782337.1 splicing factor 45-like [Tetranychus urticae]
MSLYDDIITSNDKGDSIKDSKPSDWSGIKLLETHLLSKKKNQAKRENLPRRPVNSFGGPGFGFKSKTIVDETPISSILDYHGKNTNGSLLGGDWDVTQEYDPLFPNDYEKIAKERSGNPDKVKVESDKSRDLDDHDKRRRSDKPSTATVASTSTSGIIVNPTGGTMFARSLVDAYSDDEEEDVKPYAGFGKSAPVVARGAAIAPPPSLIESTVVKSSTNEMDASTSSSSSGPKGSVAAKIMARMGYKEGQGLGKEEQGISRALEVEKTSKRGGKIIAGTKNVSTALLPPPPPPAPISSSQSVSEMMPGPSSGEATSVESITELMKNPTKVVLLRNMVGPGEVDDDLEPEVKEECSKYGEVVKCVIYEIHGGHPEDAVRIFVEFKRVEAAIKAVVDLNGRYFGGRIVKISFYDVEKFKRLELND